MTDLYANYFCQKLYLILEKEDRIKCLNYLKPSAVLIANSKIGTYPLQAVVELIKYDEERLIILDAFKNYVFELCFVYYY